MTATLAIADVARGQFQDLARKLPDGANTVVMIDFAKLQNTPLAKKELWREQHQKLFEAGLEIVPPTAAQFLGAAKLDFKSMSPEWQVAFMELSQEPSLPKLTVRFNGTLDRLADRDVAVLPGDIYVVKFGKEFVGVGMPANRQDVDRWLAKYDTNSLAGLSPYLKEAQSFAEKNSPITLAIDLQGVVSPAATKSRLVAANDKIDADLDRLSVALASIRGMTLGVSVDDKMTGAVKVDFAQDISALGDGAKAVLLDTLADHGMMIDDLDDWKVTVQEKQILLSGPMSASGLRRILSLLNTPPPLYVSKENEGMSAEEEKRSLTIAATQSYFNSVKSLLEDLRNDKKSRQTLGQISVWFGNYARKIDRLPLLNVDPEMLEFSNVISNTLRTGQMDVTDAAASSRLRQQNVDQYDVQSYGWYGWTANYDPAATARASAQVRTQEQIRGARSANTVMQQMESATADIRRYMTQKYQVEF